jgi:hypothetical protein
MGAITAAALGMKRARDVLAYFHRLTLGPLGGSLEAKMKQSPWGSPELF